MFVKDKSRPNVLSAGGQASILKTGPLIRNARNAAAVEKFIVKAAMGLVENEQALAAERATNDVAAISSRCLADQYEVGSLRNSCINSRGSLYAI